MGSIWMHWLPDYLSQRGVNFRLHEGWMTRARSTGGFDNIMNVQCHHTASKTTPENDIAYNWYNADSRPIGNFLLDRTGLVHFGVAGASNTGGKGGPRWSSRGTIPLDNCNRNVPAIEAANDGRGEAWPVVQQDAYIKLCVAILEGASKETPGAVLGAGDVHSHHEWAPTRKVDPSGPSRFAPGATETWNMDTFRGEVWYALQPPPPPPGKTTEMTDDARYYVRPGVGPWRAAVDCYGNGDAPHQLLLTTVNPGTWHPGDRIRIPGKVGIKTIVQEGEGPWQVLRRMYQDYDEKPPPSEDGWVKYNVPKFVTWNGGMERVPKAGDPVFFPTN